jgi:hypothetical protein
MHESDLGRRYTVRVDDEDWRETRSLGEAGPDDGVFVVDPSTGRVEFGDGMHGRRPPDGSAVSVSYRDGGGGTGSACVSITTHWPPRDSRYVVALSAAGVRIGRAGGGVDRFAGAKRPSYFDGQLLSANDLRDEQRYLMERRYRHNLALHGWGVVAGMAVTISGDASSASLVVEPGLALDPSGREIGFDTPVVLPIGIPECPLYVIVEYAERETDPVPVSTSGTGIVASRIEEGASIRLSHDTHTDGVALARLVPDSTGWKVDGAFEPSRCR